MRGVSDYLKFGLVQLQSLPPLSLYIHLPWCIKKCPYCDFNSHAVTRFSSNRISIHQEVPVDIQTQYIQALLADLDAALPLIWGRNVHSIFIGGGTPSLFSPKLIADLLSQLRARLPLSAGLEITLEANPGTFERHRFKAFREAGITRLSIGVQSFNDQHLKTLGRVHTAKQAREAVEEAATYFETFNLDLMYALPQQTLVELKEDISAAFSFQPPHLSIYHLTIEPNTWFAKYPPLLPDDDQAYAMLDVLTEATQQAGLQRYEVSAFAKDKSHRCWHNLNYWQFGDYLGIGAGAHSKLSFPHRIVRQVRVREPLGYMTAALEGRAITIDEDISLKELPFEFMLGALRLTEGVPLSYFTQRTGLSSHAIEHGLEIARQRGLMTSGEGQELRASEHGFNFLSDLQQIFLPSS